MGITIFLFFCFSSANGAVKREGLYNNNGGTFKNHAPTNGFNDILKLLLSIINVEKSSFFVFLNPSNEILPYLHLKPIVSESILAKSICQILHSRARGVANLENMIPMLGGKRFFFDPRAAWECQF